MLDPHPSRWAPRRSSPTRHLTAWGLLGAVGAALFFSSFEAWGDPIIDLGRDLYLPSQLLEGRLLYRELLYNYGPAAPYLLAGVVALLGDALWVFETVGLLVGLATMAALYVIGSQLGGALQGFASALLFLVLALFASSSWGCNFVLPYSFAATFGIAFAAWSFALLLRYLYGRRRPAVLAGSVALLFAALLAKQEVGLAIAGVHLLAWWAHRISRRAILLTLGSGALVGALFLALFAARDAGEHGLVAENLGRFVADAESTRFFRVVAGLDRPGQHLLRSLGAVGKVAALLLLGALAGMALARARAGRRSAALLLAAASAAACAGLVWLWAGVRLFEAVPLLGLAVAVHCALCDRRDPLLLLAAFTLLCAARVLLQFHPMWYGFYLLVPAYPFVVHALGGRLHARISAPARRGALVALVAVALLLVVRFEWTMWQAYRSKTSVLVTAKGRMRDVPDGRVAAISQFLAYAEERLVPERPELVVLPEGVSLNYFTGLRNPIAYYLFTPPEVGSAMVERRVVRELATASPELLLFTSRDLGEFGRRGIGIDYALELGDWIRGAYDLERVFEGGGERPWRLVLLRRRQGGAGGG